MKAIALISGGLDSILAAKVIQEEGIEVIPLNFKIPFCQLKKESNNYSLEQLVKDTLGLDLKTIDISDEFLKLIENPRYGFGSQVNPCIDCKILMLSKAKELLKDLDASFVITGEVLGQRPMSQNRSALDIISKRSGLEGLILRPLSAKILSETIPEIKGWIIREHLLNFGGRTRKPQIALAQKYKIKEYAQPAGGCLLTYADFAKRLKDLIKHKSVSLENIKLLKFGRHFRLSQEAKLIVGRNEKENQILVNLAQDNDYLFYPNEHLAGPTCLGRGEFNEGLFKISLGIASHYCDQDKTALGKIIFKVIPSKEEEILDICPAKKEVFLNLRI
jgi:tRNA U34 2-thiouridine synthase MnmA/TrmU